MKKSKLRFLIKDLLNKTFVPSEGELVVLEGYENFKFVIYKVKKWNIAEFSTGLPLIHKNNGEGTKKAAIEECLELLRIQAGNAKKLQEIINKQISKFGIVNKELETDLTNIPD